MLKVKLIKASPQPSPKERELKVQTFLNDRKVANYVSLSFGEGCGEAKNKCQ